MSVAAIERVLTPDQDLPEGMPQGIAFSAILHLVTLLLIALGLPVLFHRPPPEDMPIAVQLVTIAPDTKATQPNPYKPRSDAKPDLPVAPPAPKPEPKPEPPIPVPEPPPSAAAPPPIPAPLPEPPKPEVKPAPPLPPEPAKPEIKAPPPPPPPPQKPVEAMKPLPPPPPRPPEPKPKPEPRPVAVAAPKPEQRKADPAAFAALLSNLNEKQEKREKTDQPAFDSLLKNLTREQRAEAEDAPPQPRRQMASAAPSSQPKAPLGAQLTASEMDLLREQLYHCWNVPAGARDARDLVIEVRVSVNPDGTVRQATLVDQGRLGDPLYRAAAESARRAFFNPHCTPLRVPQGKYEIWKDLVVDFSPKDVL
jgi:hypothetical protein